MAAFVHQRLDDDLRTFRAGPATERKVDLEAGAAKQCCSPSQRDRLVTVCAYLWFGVCTGYVADQFSDRDFSAILTLSAAVQCFGLLLLCYKVRVTKTVQGLSKQSLQMYVIFFCFRLSSSLFKNGYIPVDRSGRTVYQMMDVLSFLVVLQLLYCIHKTHKSTYQDDKDSMPIMPLVPPCILLATFLHADLNRSPLFDTIWTTSLNLDTVAMLPQLWMLTKIGGAVEGMTSNFVVAIAASRLCAFTFWFYGYEELAEYEGGPNFAGKQILGAHVLQLLLSADFLYYYLSARFSGKRMVLPQQDVEV